MWALRLAWFQQLVTCTTQVAQRLVRAPGWPLYNQCANPQARYKQLECCGSNQLTWCTWQFKATCVHWVCRLAIRAGLKHANIELIVPYHCKQACYLKVCNTTQTKSSGLHQLFDIAWHCAASSHCNVRCTAMYRGSYDMQAHAYAWEPVRHVIMMIMTRYCTKMKQCGMVQQQDRAWADAHI